MAGPSVMAELAFRRPETAVGSQQMVREGHDSLPLVPAFYCKETAPATFALPLFLYL